MKTYSLTIDTLHEEKEERRISLRQTMQPDTYVVVDDHRLIWITDIKGDHLFGVEQTDSLEECSYLIENRIRC